MIFVKKILIVPNSKEMVDEYLTTDISGFVLSMENLSVNSACYFTIDDIKELVKKTDKEICISLNKTMTNEDLLLLERTLIELNNLNVSKVLFYDLAIPSICKRENLKIELAVFQDHLNASINSNMFYKKRGIHTTVITNDITMDEINDISKYQSLMMICYGYLPIFYSRRYLITNYLNYVGEYKNNSLYNIQNKDDKYIIEEEGYGPTVYTKEPVIVMTLSEAAEERQSMRLIEATKDCISGGFVSFYPPGIPILCPGELITGEIIRQIKIGMDKGLTATGVKEGQIAIVAE